MFVYFKKDVPKSVLELFENKNTLYLVFYKLDEDYVNGVGYRIINNMNDAVVVLNSSVYWNGYDFILIDDVKDLHI